MKIPQISLGLAIYITIAACGLVTMAAIDKYGYSETSKKPSVKKADDCVKLHQHKDSKQPRGGEKPQGGKKHTQPKQVPNGGPPTLKRKVHNSSQGKPKGKPNGNRK